MLSGMRASGYSISILDRAIPPPGLSGGISMASYRSSIGRWYMKSMSVCTTMGCEYIVYAYSLTNSSDPQHHSLCTLLRRYSPRISDAATGASRSRTSYPRSESTCEQCDASSECTIAYIL
jgi:hypothetical protein